jgi:hypothetical protein
MEYRVGLALFWQRNNNFDAPELVSVVELRRGGCAKLSNGWIVDEDGIAEGTTRVQGGAVRALVPIELAKIPQNGIDSAHPGT